MDKILPVRASVEKGTRPIEPTQKAARLVGSVWQTKDQFMNKDRGSNKMKAFLSYTSRDANLARRVAEMLRIREVDVWFDQRDLRPGDPLGSALVSGISAVDYFVILITEASAHSNWVQFEVGNAIQRAVEAGLRLIPLVFDNAQVPNVLAAYKWVPCRNEEDAAKAMNQALAVSSLPKKAPHVQDSHPAPRFGLRLVTSNDFQSAKRLGIPERKYVLIGDYFEQWGRSLREVMENLFYGQYFDRVNQAAAKWIAVVFEIGEIHSKNYDVFPATWKAIYRILSDPGRCAMFPPSEQAMKALRRPPRDYRRDDGYPWEDWVRAHLDISKLEKILGLYNECFVGKNGLSFNGSRIFLVRNLELDSLNARVLELGTPDEGIRIQ
jgi:hypothetical protein